MGPGVYHEAGTPEDGVLITTPGVRVRGMDRNQVVVAGTASSAAQPCSNDPAVQNPGLSGRNGIEVKADGVYVDNLTVCNFLSGAGGGGNQVWWNGGDGSGKTGMTTYWGNYLTGSSSATPGAPAASTRATPATWGTAPSTSAPAPTAMPPSTASTPSTAPSAIRGRTAAATS